MGDMLSSTFSTHYQPSPGSMGGPDDERVRRARLDANASESPEGAAQVQALIRQLMAQDRSQQRNRAARGEPLPRSFQDESRRYGSAG